MNENNIPNNGHIPTQAGHIPTQAGHIPTQAGNGHIPTQVTLREEMHDHLNSVRDETLRQVFGQVNSVPHHLFEREALKVTVLEGFKGRYTVEDTLGRGGESVIRLCTAPDGTKVVAKIFTMVEGYGEHSLLAREKVIEFMKTEAGQRLVLPILDYGTVALADGFRNYFEIYPYCAEGDLHNKRFTYQELRPVIQTLNETLHTLHQAGILHLDIKPDNLFMLEDRLVIGDFGVARTTANGFTNAPIGSDGFRAPEIYMVTGAHYIGPKCDYYSLGVTLACLYLGRFLFDDKSDQLGAISEGKLPLPQNTEPELRTLLNGMIRISPTRRFGYEEVAEWLANPYAQETDYAAPAEGQFHTPFAFQEHSCKNAAELFTLLTSSPDMWQKAAYFLYNKTFENFFNGHNIPLQMTANELENTYRTDRNRQDYGVYCFLKALYPAGGIVWRGQTWRGLPALAEKMMRTAYPLQYAEMMRHGVLTHWYQHTEGITPLPETLALLQEMEKLAHVCPEMACYWFGFAFAEKKEYILHEQAVTDLKELFNALLIGPSRFYGKGGACGMLLDAKAGAMLFGFLCSYGHQEQVGNLLAGYGELKEWEKLHLALVFLEAVATAHKLDPAPLHRFYLTCGPVAHAYYVRKNCECYVGVNDAGKKQVALLRALPLPTPGPIETTHNGMLPLLKLVSDLENNLQNNPYLARAGVYGKYTVACTNMKGYFLAKTMGRLIPLGLARMLETDWRETND